jgi:hypothetical protein
MSKPTHSFLMHDAPPMANPQLRRHPPATTTGNKRANSLGGARKNDGLEGAA